MTLNSVLTKVKGGTVVTVYDYLSEECIINEEVAKVLDNSYYHQNYKNCRVYGIEPNCKELEIRVMRE